MSQTTLSRTGHDTDRDPFLDLAGRFEAIPDCPGGVVEILGLQALATPDRPYLRVGDRSLTFAELDQVVASRADALRRAGVQRGDRVAYLCDAGFEVVQLLYAVWRLGAINVPLNIFLRGKPLEYQLRDSGSETVVVDRSGLETIQPLLAELPGVKRIVLTESDTDEHGLGDIELLPFDQLVGTPDAAAVEPVGAADPAAIMYTSGTTGMPKGCILSHRYFHHVGREWTAVLELGGDDILLSANPLYHFGGLIPLMAALVSGIPLVVEPVFSGSQFLPRANEVGATVSIGMEFLSVGLLSQPEGPADRRHSIRTMMLAPVSEQDRNRFYERFGIKLVTDVFGQTECTLMACSVVDGKHKPGGAGRPSPWVELAVLDADGWPVQPGEAGEIVVRPKRPGVMYDGYWNKPDVTLQTWRGLWHHTGDLGRLDEEGFLFFVDRKNDAIRRRGENVSSLELEQIIAGHDAVLEAAVVPITVPGEVDATIKACLVLSGTAELTVEGFAQYLNDELPYFAVPRFVELMDELPRNASGRVMKFELRERPNDPPVWDLEALGLLRTRTNRRD